jgi:hypothetical protein
MTTTELFGVGLYTPAEAARLLSIPAARLSRWLRGHRTSGKTYEPLWSPQVDLGDGSLHLGFRDLIEARTANEFIKAGLSAQAVRRAIVLARDLTKDGWPLSTTRFRTDGRSIFFEEIQADGQHRMIDLLRGQYAFAKIMERSLRNVDFDGIRPSQWWIESKRGGIVIDPARSFGQPVDDESGVPTAVLAQAFSTWGDARRVARDWDIAEASVARAVDFELGRTKLAA